MPQRVIHVGIGTFGKRWCREFLKQNVDDHTIKVVALVDIDPKNLEYGRAQLGLPESACFTDAREAFGKVSADFCTVVVPPNLHEAIIDLAIEFGLDVLCEKPIADSMEGSVRIARKIKQAGRKMAVTMSHRFRPGQSHSSPCDPLGQARPGGDCLLSLPGRYAAAFGMGCAVPAHDARPHADRGGDPPSGHRCRPGRSQVRHPLRIDVAARLGRVSR